MRGERRGGKGLENCPPRVGKVDGEVGRVSRCRAQEYMRPVWRQAHLQGIERVLGSDTERGAWRLFGMGKRKGFLTEY